MNLYWLLLGVLGVWRVAHLLHAEDGPWDIIVRLRKRAGAGVWATLLDCFYCLSLWIAVPFALLIGESWKERLFLWPAISAGAIILEDITRRVRGAPKAPFIEDQEERNAVLRPEKGAALPEDPGPREH